MALTASISLEKNVYWYEAKRVLSAPYRLLNKKNRAKVDKNQTASGVLK